MVLRPFRQNRMLQGMIAWLLLVWLLAAIEPNYPREWLLQNLLVFSLAGILAATYRRFQFSNLAYSLLTLFTTLHLVGSHYTYTETPFGFWMQGWFGFERNHYDRLVHFGFGLLVAWQIAGRLHPRLGAIRERRAPAAVTPLEPEAIGDAL